MQSHSLQFCPRIIMLSHCRLTQWLSCLFHPPPLALLRKRVLTAARTLLLQLAVWRMHGESAATRSMCRCLCQSCSLRRHHTMATLPLSVPVARGDSPRQAATAAHRVRRAV